MTDVYGIAEEIGFSHYGPLNTEKLWFREEVRDMCKANRCGRYNANWACPPACGTLEESAQRASAYDAGIIVQTTAQMEDDFDAESMMEARSTEKKHLRQLIDRLAEEGLDMLPMSSGSCELCKKCAYPEPCRFPARRVSSMEAYGLVVSDTCRDSGVKYYYGPQTITFTGCILFHKKDIPADSERSK